MCYTRSMTEKDIIAHWREGARQELKSAHILCKEGQYAGALFHCHLAVEKALKAQYMHERREAAPLTHDLLQVALQLTHTWGQGDKEILADLTAFAVKARYDDPYWAESEATAENVHQWITQVERLISTITP